MHASQVCFNAFIFLYDVSEKTAYKRVREVKMSEDKPHKRQALNARKWTGSDTAVEWMRDYFDTAACIMPTSNGSTEPDRQLPSFLTKQLLYELYQDYIEEEGKKGNSKLFHVAT